MTPRTPTLPPTDGAMWRKLLAKVHPDAGGTHELFIWVGSVKDVVCNLSPSGAGSPEPEDYPSRRREGSTWHPTHADNRERIAYPDGGGSAFEAATAEALRMAEELGTFNVYGGILRLLADCEPMAQYDRQERRGASFKQLAAIAHTAGMSSPERSGWYRIAEAIPLSDRHAGHILGRLKRQAA